MIWENKRILREIYTEWYRVLLGDLADVPGRTLELGAGSGNFKAFKPDAVSSDIEVCSWLDACFDAHALPFKTDSIGNIVLIDVLHHLARPLQFLEEAFRVLRTGGRVLMIEPFPSPFSLFIYRRFHPEPFIFDQDFFQQSPVAPGSDCKDPWDANQAAAYLLFFKHRKRFLRVMGERFKVVTRFRMSCLLYPASGGFENKSKISDGLIPLFKFFEKIAVPLRPLMAFRCYVVLEKVSSGIEKNKIAGQA